MPVVKAQVRVELKLNDAWVDVTSDLHAGTPIRGRYGMAGSGPLDRVAQTGELSFALRNSHLNSAGKLGYYSPGHSACRTGFGIGTPVRLVFVYGDLTYYKWRGRIDSILPDAGRKGTRLSRVRCVDWMNEAALTTVSGLPAAFNKRSDEVFTALVGLVADQPPAIQIATGLDTYPYAFDDTRDEETRVLTEFSKLAESELGFVYVRGDTETGGVLVFESREKRGNASTNVQTFDNSMVALTAGRARGDIINKVTVVAHPRKVDASPTSVLYELQSQPEVGPHDTLTILGPYVDGTGKRCGGTDLQPLVAGTDYRMNSAADGSGIDLTAHFTITPAFGGNGVRFEITNTGNISGFVTKLRALGKAITFTDAVAEAADPDSRHLYGANTVKLDMAYQPDPRLANEAAYYLLALYKSPTTSITSLSFRANSSDDLMRGFLLREISDRIGVKEDVTGVSESISGSLATRGFFINAVEFQIDGRTGEIICSWTLAPADLASYWILEQPGASELDETTTLGFGMIIGHADLAHADAHGDVVHTDILHGDTQHSDHTDTHSDTHADVLHSDVPHTDSAHEDIHADVTHLDVAHSDSHSDVSHVDVAHADRAYTDWHDDEGIRRDPDHLDDHADISHLDSHADTAHADTHSDKAHSDRAHSDTHSDEDYEDVDHSDVLHSDHTDLPYSDGHADTHADVLHADALHGDVIHVDEHDDVPHGDS